MRTYEVSMTIFSKANDGLEILDSSDSDFEFQAEKSEAKDKLLTECRNRLRKFNLNEIKSVLICCVLVPEVGKIADAGELIRSRFKLGSISSIMTVAAEELFVEGYGPKVWKELSK